ncbi:MAG: hypothetical protein GY801_01140 [bacterium]|nr:hypothetical protein [bacterium]
MRGLVLVFLGAVVAGLIAWRQQLDAEIAAFEAQGATSESKMAKIVAEQERDKAKKYFVRVAIFQQSMMSEYSKVMDECSDEYSIVLRISATDYTGFMSQTL